MTIKITTPNGGSDSLDFGCAQTAIVATVTGTEVSSGEGKLAFNTTTSGTSKERMRLLNNGTLEAQSPASATGIQAFKIDWKNENNAGIMASIGCDRTASSAAPGDLVFSTSTSVDSGAISEKMRVTSAGNVGIGTTAPAAKLDVATPASTMAEIRLTTNNTGSGAGDRGRLNVWTAKNDGTAFQAGYIDIDRSSGTETLSHMLFATNGGSGATERMRIDKSGNVLVGTTSLIGDSSRLNISYTYTNSGIGLKSNTASAHNAIMFTNTNGTVGTIITSGSSTAYNTSSDYRLKENVQYEWSATERLKKLKPAQFNFLSDPDNTVDGFLAHEAQEVVPEAVTGVKDEVDDDDKPVMQGIDQSKLVPLLVKTIQELEARIAKLEEDK